MTKQIEVEAVSNQRVLLHMPNGDSIDVSVDQDGYIVDLLKEEKVVTLHSQDFL